MILLSPAASQLPPEQLWKSLRHSIEKSSVCISEILPLFIRCGFQFMRILMFGGWQGQHERGSEIWLLMRANINLGYFDVVSDMARVWTFSRCQLSDAMHTTVRKHRENTGHNYVDWKQVPHTNEHPLCLKRFQNSRQPYQDLSFTSVISLLQTEMCQPRSLKRLCRTTIVQCIYGRLVAALPHFTQLPLKLQKYLFFQDICGD